MVFIIAGVTLITLFSMPYAVEHSGFDGLIQIEAGMKGFKFTLDTRKPKKDKALPSLEL